MAELSAEGFERQYAERSGISVGQLRELGRVVRPCECGEDGCEGWQSVNRESWEEDQRFYRGSSMTQPETEHPERERLAKELWWSLCRDWSMPQIDRLWPQLSAEGLNSDVYEIADRVLALLRPEAASPPEGREPEPVESDENDPNWAERPPEQCRNLFHYKFGGPDEPIQCGRCGESWKISPPGDVVEAIKRYEGAKHVSAETWNSEVGPMTPEPEVRYRFSREGTGPAARAPAAPVDRGLVERLRGRAEWIDRKLPFTSLVFVELRRDFMTATADDLREAANALERAPVDRGLVDGVKVALLQPEWMHCNGSEQCPLCGADRFEDGKHDPACLRINIGMELRSSAALERAPEARAGEVT